MSTETLPELDADLVERTAKAIGLARINTDYPGDPQISADGYALYWQQTNGEERTRLRQQAVAALRGSELLKRVEDLERAINTARSHLHDLDYQGPSVAAAEQVLNRAVEKTT